MSGQPWSSLDSSEESWSVGERQSAARGRYPTLQMSYAFRMSSDVGAPVKLSAILLHHILQKSGNECTLLWATCSDYIVVFAVSNEVKEHLVEISFLGLCPWYRALSGSRLVHSIKSLLERQSTRGPNLDCLVAVRRLNQRRKPIMLHV